LRRSLPFCLALELSKSTWLVAIHSAAVDKISQHRLAGGDATALLSLIERKYGEAQAALLRPVRVMSCYEAGYDGFWLHRLLCDHGIDNRVGDAASILVDRRFRRGKTDRLDVAALLRTLIALARGEPRVCREVRAPSVEQEDERRRSRERARLVNERLSICVRLGPPISIQSMPIHMPNAVSFMSRGSKMRSRRNISNVWTEVRDISSPSTYDTVLYIRFSPGWCIRGGVANHRVHSSTQETVQSSLHFRLCALIARRQQFDDVGLDPRHALLGWACAHIPAATFRKVAWSQPVTMEVEAFRRGVLDR
jgi:hypothetical protein